MSANTSFSTTTSKLNLFISKQTITNNQVSSDLSSTEYPIKGNEPIYLDRSDFEKLTYLYIRKCNSGTDGYLQSVDYNVFNSKLSSLISGTNIYASPSGITPTISLSISSPVDMSNQSIINLSSEDYKTDINIKQAGNSRIYTSGSDMIISPSGSLHITPSSGFSITSNINMNSKTIDMSNGSIIGISNEDFKENIDIRLKGKPRIYTTNGSNMAIDASGILTLMSTPVNMNSNELIMGGANIKGVNGLYFDSDKEISIYKGLTRIIYTNVNDINFEPLGNIIMGNNVDMSNQSIYNILFENYKTDINIKQAGISRIYTSGLGSDMTINPLGNINIQQNGADRIKTVGNDMTITTANNMTINPLGNINIQQNGADRIKIVGNDMTITTANNMTINPLGNINIQQNGADRIKTVGNNMTISPNIAGNLTITSDTNMNGKTLDMVNGVITGISNENYTTDIDIRQNGTKRIYTSGTDLFLNPVGDVSLTGKNIDMVGGNITDISGLYSLPGEILRIDASNISFTNGTNTHVVIDNCGIILNDISSSNTGTVLTFDTTTNRVNYYPLYDSSSFLIDLSGGIYGGSTFPFTMKISQIGNTVTMGISDVSGVFSTTTPSPYIYTNPAINVKYRPSSNIYFPALIYNNGAIRNGKALLRNDGYMRFYTNVIDASSSWIQNISGGLLSQCFTYTTL
jgi:hypothetical protein